MQTFEVWAIHIFISFDIDKIQIGFKQKYHIFMQKSFELTYTEIFVKCNNFCRPMLSLINTEIGDRTLLPCRYNERAIFKRKWILNIWNVHIKVIFHDTVHEPIQSDK